MTRSMKHSHVISAPFHLAAWCSMPCQTFAAGYIGPCCDKAACGLPVMSCWLHCSAPPVTCTAGCADGCQHSSDITSRLNMHTLVSPTVIAGCKPSSCAFNRRSPQPPASSTTANSTAATAATTALSPGYACCIPCVDQAQCQLCSH